MIQLRVNLRKNNNEKSDSYGNYFAELERPNTLSLRGLANHIADHNTIFGRDVVVGVLTKLAECIPELLAQGQPVKLDGLGIFYPTAKNKKGGAPTLDDAKAMGPNGLVDGVRVRFEPDGTQLDNLTSKAFKERCSLVFGNVIEIIGKSEKDKPIYKLTPISNPEPAPQPEP